MLFLDNFFCLKAILEICPIDISLVFVDIAGVPIENVLYLGGPNIAAEIYNKEYANARICGAEKWRKPLAKFIRQSHFIVWDNSDLVTHEVMGGLKNVYAIGAGKFLRDSSDYIHRFDPLLLFLPQEWWQRLLTRVLQANQCILLIAHLR